MHLRWGVTVTTRTYAFFYLKFFINPLDVTSFYFGFRISEVVSTREIKSIKGNDIDFPFRHLSHGKTFSATSNRSFHLCVLPTEILMDSEAAQQAIH